MPPDDLVARARWLAKVSTDRETEACLIALATRLEQLEAELRQWRSDFAAQYFEHQEALAAMAARAERFRLLAAMYIPRWIWTDEEVRTSWAALSDADRAKHLARADALFTDAALKEENDAG